MPRDQMRQFFTGLHQVADAKRIPAVFISVNRLLDRVSDFEVDDWIMDSAAFTELAKYGRYRHGPEEYAGHVNRWCRCGNMLAAVTQDYMCEPFMLARTGLTVKDHQRLTIERYDAIQALTSAYIMPVLQGYQPHEYVEHIRMYGDRLKPGMWVGVGSVCKRNSNPNQVAAVLRAIKKERPDLLLHAFGIKLTALADGEIFEMIHTADSMAWSFAARLEMLHYGTGFGGNDHRSAKAYASRIQTQERQYGIPELLYL